MFEGRATMVPLLPGQALSGAKAIATRTLPLYTLDHMAALLLRVYFLWLAYRVYPSRKINVGRTFSQS